MLYSYSSRIAEVRCTQRPNAYDAVLQQCVLYGRFIVYSRVDSIEIGYRYCGIRTGIPKKRRQPM